MRVRELFFNRRDTDKRPYEVAIIDAGGVQIQVMESPHGRSVQIHVNGEQVWKSSGR